MSRSYKEPWIKDPANSYGKRIHARRMRSKVHQIMHVFKDDKENWDIGPSIPDARVVTNKYTICDYIFYSSNPTSRRK